MLAPTSVCPSVEAASVVPTTDSRFEAVRDFMVGQLLVAGATYEIIDPQIDLIEKRWFAEEPDHAEANRKVIIEAAAATPDLLATAETYSSVTGVQVEPVLAITANHLTDIEKPPELSIKSQKGPLYLMDTRIRMMAHVMLGARTIDASALPEYFKGMPFKSSVVKIDAEHHGMQPFPSLRYGCGYDLGLDLRPYRDIIANVDWFGAKFYRDNAGNRDNLGQPLPDDVRSQELGAYLLYMYDRGPDPYWNISPQNNPWRLVLSIYETFRRNHPSRLPDPEHAFSGDMSLLNKPPRPYIDVTKIDFNNLNQSVIDDLGVAA